MGSEVELVLVDLPVRTASGIKATCPARVPVKIAAFVVFGDAAGREWGAARAREWLGRQAAKKARGKVALRRP